MYTSTYSTMSSYYYFRCSGVLRALHPFPTRRSSDLSIAMQAAEALGIPAEDVRPVVVDTDSVGFTAVNPTRSEEHTSELQSPMYLVCRLLLEKKKTQPSSTELINALTTSQAHHRVRT